MEAASRTGLPVAAPAVPEVPADLAPCADCLRELFDPAGRRHRYAFISCAACGPRAAIVEGLPYARERTTMRRFDMCAACAAEYHDPAGRRFHAETVACPSCGPRLRFLSLTGDSALRAAAALVAAGGVIAVEGYGGLRIMGDAMNEDAVARLRRIGERGPGPLAVMVRDTITAGALGHLTDADRHLLESPAAPVVLAPRRQGVLSAAVCAGMPDVGLALPPTPLHHLLLDAVRRPLVTAGVARPGEDLEVDGVLTHDLPIATRYDDTVVRSFGNRSIMVRRGRGLAFGPSRLPVAAPRPLVALGDGTTFTLADGAYAVLGPHLGEPPAYEDALERFQTLHGIVPVHAAHDLDPHHPTTRAARRWRGRTAVQHHHAHVTAVAAEHGLEPPFLGLAYDAPALGDDGTRWGGELLLADYAAYRRLGRFSHAPMPGGRAAAYRPARMALGYLLGGETTGGPIPEGLVAGLPDRKAVGRMIGRWSSCPSASSAALLFDAAAALLGLCEANGFDGEAALRLERAAAAYPGAEPLAWRLERQRGIWVYDSVITLRDLLEARADGEPAGRVAAAFHATIAAVTVLMCERSADAHDVTQVCLSGGVFQNRLLATDVLARLTRAGFEPYIGERVPVTCDGVSFGQAATTAARLSCV